MLEPTDKQPKALQDNIFITLTCSNIGNNYTLVRYRHSSADRVRSIFK